MSGIETSVGISLSSQLVENYFDALINQFFKILPMKENNESSLRTYMGSLQSEMMGCNELILCVHDNPMLVSLLSILQFLIDSPECSVSKVKREVFRAISICNKLKEFCRQNDDSGVK